MASQDAKGTKETKVRSLKKDQHLGNLGNQDGQDSEGLKDSRAAQVLTVYLEHQGSQEIQVNRVPQGPRD